MLTIKPEEYTILLHIFSYFNLTICQTVLNNYINDILNDIKQALDKC